MPESTPLPSCLPSRAARCALLAACLATPLAAQGDDRTAAVAAFHKEPGGTVLGRLERGAAVTLGATRGTWREVTVQGWVPAAALRNDSRDGFDVAVALAAGTSLRTLPSAEAPVRATAVAGALFDRMETRTGWVLVRRTGWMPAASAAAPGSGTPPPQPPPPPPPPPAAAGNPPLSAATADSGRLAVAAGTALSAAREGEPVGQLSAPVAAEVVERRQGWSRVRIEAWVPDRALEGARPQGVTAEQLRSDPDRYVGATVEWRLQVLAVREADELRPELPRGQAYLLARGPLPETGFVYLTLSAEQASTFRGLEPLTEVMVRATIRAGRSRFLATPVLDLVDRID